MIRPRLLFSHDPRRRLAHFVQPRQIDSDDSIPLFAGKLVDGHAMLPRVDSRVVDQDIEMSEVLDDARSWRRFGRDG